MRMSSGPGRVGRRFAAALAGLVALGACQTLPYVDRDRLPTVAVIEDGSSERTLMNARVYDMAVEAVTRRFYKRDFGGVDWASEAAARRPAALQAATEAEFYTVLNETLATLGDRHTTALRPSRHLQRQRERLQPRRNLGFDMRIVESQFIVTQVREGSPAEAAGIRRGWRVETLNGEPVSRDTRLHGVSEHRLVFTDAEGETHERTIADADLPPLLGHAESRDDGVLVISFDYFAPATANWFEAQMRAAAADPPRGIIVDLRDNSGGLLTSVGRTLAPFFAARQPYAYVEVGYLPRFPNRTPRRRAAYDGPVAVLLSSASASGAEVFAATVQEAGRGPVVGAPSAGAVIASRQIYLPDGGELSIGVRGFRSGQGRLLDGVGVTPDVPAELNAADLRRGRDPVVETAAALLLAD